MIHFTAVAPGTVGTVPTVPPFLAGTANRTTIWTEKNRVLPLVSNVKKEITSL